MVTLSPTALVGRPGDTIGWGFTFTNDSADWLWINGIDFSKGIGRRGRGPPPARASASG
jgi:hypothetical protein